MKAILVVALLAVAVSAVPIPWKNCGKAGDIISVQTSDASVWPPQRGKDITLIFKAQIAQDIPDANYDAQIKLMGIPIINKKGKLSEIKGVPLPIKAGPQTINQTINVPTIIPAGATVQAHVALTLLSGAGVICVDVTIPFKVEEDEVVEQMHNDAIASILSGDSSVEDYFFPPQHPEIPIPWKNCGKTGDIVSVQTADASVWPPQRGKAITLNIAAQIASAIPDGNYAAQIKFNGIQIINKKGKLSEIKDIKLPIPAGPFSLNKTVTVPTLIPAGSTIAAHVELTTLSGAGVVCVDVSIPFKVSDNEDEEEGSLAALFNF
jgi:hypothetical protein